MWRFWTQTTREKQGMLDGINLFFGALIGANLGSLEGLSPKDYTTLVVILAGAVIALRVFSTSERRGYAYLTLAVYFGFVALHLFGNDQSIRSIGIANRDRLALTLGVWLASIVLAELAPIRDPKSGRSG
jgi:hypothetical protein